MTARKPIPLDLVVARLRVRDLLSPRGGPPRLTRAELDRLLAVADAALALYDGAGDVDAEQDALGALMVAVRGRAYRPTKPRTKAKPKPRTKAKAKGRRR